MSTKAQIKSWDVYDILMIMAGLLLPMLLLRYDILWLDECYQLMSVANFQDNPMAPLTFAMGHWWQSIFGDGILAIRIFMRLLYSLSIAIGCAFFYVKIRNARLTSLMFMTLCFAACIFGMNIFNWDTSMFIFEVIMIWLCIDYWQTPKWQNVIAIGVLTGIITMGRLPFAVALIYLLPMTIIRHRASNYRRGIYEAIVMLSAAIASAALIVLCLYGSLASYIGKLNPLYIINGHDLRDIGYVVKRLWEITFCVLSSGAFVLSLLGSCVLLTKAKRFRKLLFAGLLILWIIWGFERTTPPLQTFGGTLYYSWLLLFMFIFGFLPIVRHHRIPAQNWIIMAIAFTAMAGSNGFFERVIVIQTLPMLLVYCYDEVKPWINYFIIILSTTSLCILAGRLYNFTIADSYVDFSRYNHRYKWCLDNEDELFESGLRIFDKVREENLNFTFIGSSKYLYNYHYGTETMYSLAHFHYFDFDKEKIYYEANLGRYDAFFLNFTWFYDEPAELAKFTDYINREGFVATDLKNADWQLYIRRSAPLPPGVHYLPTE